MDSQVRVTVEGGVADVVLDRPDKLNALDDALLDGLIEAQQALAVRDDVHVVVLSGAGRAFSAGMDLSVLGDPGALVDLSARTHGVANRFQQVAWGWRELPVPVVAALHGVVLGGGLQVALGADVRIAHPAARLAVAEIRWGLVPDMAGYPLLRGLVRDDVVRELVYTGRQVDGEEAARIGLVTRTAEDPRAEALALAAEVAGRSTAAVRAAKRLFSLAADGATTAPDLLLAESREQQVLFDSGDPHRRLAAAAAPPVPPTPSTSPGLAEDRA